jgi:streptogramin lyase
MSRFLVSVLLFALCANHAAAQPEGAANQNPDQNFTRDANWAHNDGNWGGNTSWVTTDRRGQVYVLTREKPYVRVHTRNGDFVRSWNGPEEIGSAHSITIDDGGNAWISDSRRHVIRKYDANGNLLMTLGTPDEPGDNDSLTSFNQPNHVFIHANGDIYVSDGYVNSRIMHFSPDGKFIRMIGGKGGPRDGEFQAVHGVAVDSRGRIITNDSENFRMNVFNADGSFAESWPYVSRGGIEIVDNKIYVSDVNEGEVNILSLDGELIDTAYAPRAHGLGVDADGTIYTSGASRMTVWKLTPDN